MRDGENILIIRLSAIGDIVFSTALIAAINRSFPKCRISWLVEPANASLLRHPTIDEVILWPKAEWKQLWRQRSYRELWRRVMGFKRALAERRFDRVLDLQGLLKSGLLAWFTGARERIGLGSREGSRWLMTRVIDRGGDPARIGSEYLHLAQELELDAGSFEMDLHLGSDDASFVDALIIEQRLEQGFLVVAPFTTRPQKHWFESRWIALISELTASQGLPLLILGGPNDREAAEALAQRATGRVIALAGRTGLMQAAALIGRAGLLVGVDTGLTHMGIALSTPTVALFGATCPYTDTTRENARVIYHPFSCSPCRRSPSCEGAFYCMQAIGVAEVIAVAGELTARQGAAAQESSDVC
ncbi:MAG: glycosyltransferase family 9 protein [Gammaproteobacteria bacterium]|nr:glycosyltransferase family 9 protein [Gammaproteobacteria bacterium]